MVFSLKFVLQAGFAVPFCDTRICGVHVILSPIHDDPLSHKCYSTKKSQVLFDLKGCGDHNQSMHKTAPWRLKFELITCSQSF